MRQKWEQSKVIYKCSSRQKDLKNYIAATKQQKIISKEEKIEYELNNRVEHTGRLYQALNRKLLNNKQVTINAILIIYKVLNDSPMAEKTRYWWINKKEDFRR